MLVSQIVEPRKIELVEGPEPSPTGASGEILVQPEIGALCGSDMFTFEADYPEHPPQPGHSLHEIVATVLESRGSRFAPGSRVLCVPKDQRGLRERFFIDESRAIPVDPRVPVEHAVLAQPLGTVLYALRKLEEIEGLDVAVVGQGPIGQLFCAALRHLGARRIFAVDRIPERLACSPRMGATDVIDASTVEPQGAIRDRTGGALPALVVEAVGHREQQINLCIDLCRPHGTLLAFGAMTAVVDGVRWGRLYRKNLRIVTSVDPDPERDFSAAMSWIAEKHLDVSPLITHRFGLLDVQRAFDTFFERREGALKVLLDFADRSS